MAQTMGERIGAAQIRRLRPATFLSGMTINQGQPFSLVFEPRVQEMSKQESVST